jgi:eukaryotic-like serine/threonine-protein kinase
MLLKPKAKALTQIGDYDLLEKRGEGAMGAVYRARHRVTDAIVAIKVVNEQVARDAVLMKRFEREFEMAQRLDHPNIVHSVELGLSATPPYLVMEYVDGPSLGDVIEMRGAMPEIEAVALITQIAAALQEAHENGVYHRDVKPDNILIMTDGQAKLTDLGVAKDLRTNQDLTSMGKGLGTPHFMAPEQLLNAKNVDARCDIYALGATLYMMVTGVIPFHSNEPLIALFRKKARNQYTPPRQLLPTLSDHLDIVINRAMHAEIDKRYTSCGDFITALTGKRPPRRRKKEALTADVSVAPAAPAKAEKRERRATPRLPSKAEGACSAIGAERRPRWRARIKDISTAGIAILVHRRFEPGTVLILNVQGQGALRPRQLLMRAVRVARTAPREWLIGCTLVHKLTEEAVKELAITT